MEKRTGRQVSHRRKRQTAALGPREKRRLGQLGACILLFAAVFFAKGADRLADLRAELSGTLRANADFQTAFADLGRSVASGRSLADTLSELWADVFLAQERPSPQARQDGMLYRLVRSDPGSVGASAVLLREPQSAWAAFPEDPMASSVAGTSAALPVETPLVVEDEPPTAEPAVIYVEYTGPALPDNTTMDRYALGLSETVSPVLAPLSSGFGWREHPIEGGEKFHYGLDLAADLGTPVLAFAAGTVDYIGESDTYGQYLQLDHGNGVTTFYAHCSKLCVQPGQHVEAGEQVALSGASGNVTGAHLHFELKRDGVRLNPAYYIDTLS